MREHNDSENAIWESGWDGHELAQLQRLAKLSMEQKIRWLESAQQLVQRIQQSPQSPPSDNQDVR